MIQYWFLWANFMRIVWLTVRRITNFIWENFLFLMKVIQDCISVALLLYDWTRKLTPLSKGYRSKPKSNKQFFVTKLRSFCDLFSLDLIGPLLQFLFSMFWSWDIKSKCDFMLLIDGNVWDRSRTETNREI